MKQFYVSIFLIFISTAAYAQCHHETVALQEVVNQSSLIVEAEVVARQGRQTNEDSFIKTVNTLQVSRVFKGSIQGNSLEMITLGGVVGDRFNLVSSAVKLQRGTKGVFLLTPNATGDLYFTDGAQGFIRYTQSEYKASRYEDQWFSIQNELYDQLEQLSGQTLQVVGSLDFRFSPNPGGLRTQSITSVTTEATPAGIGQTITITGSSFGTAPGTGGVEFPNADDGGSSRIRALATQITSWSDSSITVEVPSGAGSGTVVVVTDGGSTFTSAQSITVPYNHTNFSINSGGVDYGVQIRLADDNGSNGYTWNYATNLTSNTDAEFTIDEGYDRWRCSTGRNFVIGTDLTGADAADTSDVTVSGDNVNVVKFDTGELPSTSGTLGFILTRGSVCGSAPSFLAFATEFDFVLNSDTNWHFRDTGSESLDFAEFDFKSVVTHELGHAQLLGHVTDPSEVMFFSIANGTSRRDISANDQLGATYINDQSVNNPAACSPGAMTYLACDYVYNSGWTPIDPSGTTNPIANISVQNGTAPITNFLTINDITIDSGTTLDLTGITGELGINGDLTNNGSLSATTLRFTGDEQAQSVSGNVISVTSLVKEGTFALNLNTNTQVTQDVSVSDGAINSNGNLQLVSSASGDAVILPITSGSISGNVIAERFYPSNRAFRFISSSVNTTTSTIFDNWQNGGNFSSGIGTHITGGLAVNGFDQTASNNPSMFSYTNTTPQSWNAVSSTNNLATDDIDAGFPFRIFIRGDRTTGNLTSPTAENDTKLQTIGTVQVGPVTENNINTTAGEFSFVGNPLHSPVDMEAVLTRPGSNVTNTYYVWDPQAADVGAYVSVNTVSNSNNDPMNSSANKFAQVQQAFFVQTTANGAASLTFNESDKSTSVNTSVNSTPASAHIYAALFESQGFNNGQSRLDGFNLTFDPSFNSGIDAYDSVKLRNVSESISTVENGQRMAIQQRAMPTDAEVIQLHHDNYRRTNYTYEFEVMGLSNLDVYLVDYYANTSQKLNPNARSTVSFTIDPNDPSSTDPLRFGLSFTDTTLSFETVPELDFKLFPNPTSGDFSIQLLNDEPSVLKVFSSTGQKLLEQELEGDLNRIRNSFTPGVYLINITSGDQNITKRLIVN